MTATTPLAQVHESAGALFTDFAGWQMPVKYTSELAEHQAVRTAAGMFDLSHMGEIRVQGAESGAFLDAAFAGRLSTMKLGQAKYTLLLAENGGILDDVIVYRLGDTNYLVVANASNCATVLEQLQQRVAGFDATVVDESSETALIAVQGPASAEIVSAAGIESEPLDGLKYYRAMEGIFEGEDILIARTGYTGEDGFELYVPNHAAVSLWETLARVGESKGLQLCGLAARDTLRLEAGMPLYGNELSREVTPFEAGLGPVVSFKKEERFVGRDALEARKAEGPERVLVGLKGSGRRAGRGGYGVFAGGSGVDGDPIGVITSGQPSPTLGYPVAIAYVDPEFSEVGTALDVDLRGKAEPFEVVALPFYKRGA